MMNRHLSGLIALAAFCATAVNAEVLAGFYAPGNDDPKAHFDETADLLSVGWSAKVSNGKAFATADAGSSPDQSFGSWAGALSAPGAIKILECNEKKAKGKRCAEFTLTNATGGAYDLSQAAFRFDWRTLDLSTGPDAFTVEVKAGGALGNAQTVTLGRVDVAQAEEWQDYDFTFAGKGFENLSMAEGEVVIKILADVAEMESKAAFIDNIAVTVGEPPALAPSRPQSKSRVAQPARPATLGFIL